MFYIQQLLLPSPRPQARPLPTVKKLYAWSPVGFDQLPAGGGPNKPSQGRSDGLNEQTEEWMNE